MYSLPSIHYNLVKSCSRINLTCSFHLFLSLIAARWSLMVLVRDVCAVFGNLIGVPPGWFSTIVWFHSNTFTWKFFLPSTCSYPLLQVLNGLQVDWCRLWLVFQLMLYHSLVPWQHFYLSFLPTFVDICSSDFFIRKERAATVNLWYKLLKDTKYKAKSSATLGDILVKNIAVRFNDLSEDIMRISRNVSQEIY